VEKDVAGTLARTSANKNVLQLIKRIILEEAEKLGIEVERIILFGSRARGDYREDSDYDILVVIKGEISRDEKRVLATRISYRIARELLLPADIIITTETRWKKYSKIVGTVEEVAANEGIPA
jgi:predicted nucleotidyltransferase